MRFLQGTIDASILVQPLPDNLGLEEREKKERDTYMSWKSKVVGGISPRVLKKSLLSSG